MAEAQDKETADAIRTAAVGLRSNDPTLGRMLAHRLRFGGPISVQDRLDLALLVTDELLPARKPGRPSTPTIRPLEQRKAVTEYIERTDAGEPAESVANEIYTRLGIRRSTLFQWLDEIRPVILQLELMGLDGLEIMKSNQPRE